MKRRFLFGGLAVVLIINLSIGAWIFRTQAAERDSAYPSLELFSYVLEKVRKDYVDGQNVKYQDLVYGALKGMLNTLDPHSEFMDAEKYKELQNDTQGAFGGLGGMTGYEHLCRVRGAHEGRQRERHGQERDEARDQY